MWVSIHNTRAWLCRALRLAASRVLPGLEEAVRASWVYPQKALVIYVFLSRFSSLWGQRGTHTVTDSDRAHTRHARAPHLRPTHRQPTHGHAVSLMWLRDTFFYACFTIYIPSPPGRGARGAAPTQYSVVP